MKSKTPVKLNAFYLLRLSGIAGISVVFFSMIINILMLTGPIFMLQVYDRVLASGSVETLITLFALVVVLFLLFGFLDFIRSRIMLQAAKKLDVQLREDAFEAIGENAIQGKSEVRTLPLSDLNSIRQYLSGQGPFGFLDAPWTPVYLAVIYILHPLLGMAAIGAAIILVVIATLNNYLTNKAAREAGQRSAKAVATIEEFRTNAEATSALGMVPVIRSRWADIHDSALGKYVSASNASGMLGALSKALRMIFQSGILGLGAYLAVRQEITPGSMIAASIIMSRALAPVDQLIGNWQGFLSYRQSCSRLSEILSDRVKSQREFSLPQPEGKLVVKGLGYRVEGNKHPILANLNFDLAPGDGLGIVGPTGSGKTTLARVLVGVSGAYFGDVMLDGAEISQYPLNEFGKYIGYMPQEVHLYEGTIAENIARMRADADQGAVIEAAKKANAHELIKSLPNGYETVLKDGGRNLSSGQRQRIGLARAVFGDPVLVVLDEPNANLDGEGEAAMVAALRTMRESGATVVVIAHRPSAVAALNKLLFIRNGQQVAFGPRDEVMEKIMPRPKPAQTKAPGSTKSSQYWSLPPAAPPSGTKKVVNDDG